MSLQGLVEQSDKKVEDYWEEVCCSDLSLVEIAFLIINRNTHRKISTIYKSITL